MDWEKVESPAKVVLAGVEVEFERNDKQITALLLSDGEHSVKVQLSGYSSLHVYVPSPPRTEERFRLDAEVVGVAVVEHFRDEYKATARMGEIEQHGGAARIERVTVAVDDDGNVIADK